MTVDVKSFLLGFACAWTMLYFGPLGIFAGLLLLFVGFVAVVWQSIQQSESTATPSTNCRSCGAPNDPGRDECSYCGDSLAGAGS